MKGPDSIEFFSASMKWVSLIAGLIAAIILGLWVADIASDRRNKLEVLEPIILLKDAPQDDPAANSETGKIHPGDAVEVLRMGYGKDFRAWRVRGPQGQKGWFIDSGRNVRVNGH